MTELIRLKSILQATKRIKKVKGERLAPPSIYCAQGTAYLSHPMPQGLLATKLIYLLLLGLSPNIVLCKMTQCKIVSCDMTQCSGMGYILQAWSPTDVYDVSFTCCTGSYFGYHLHHSSRYTLPQL